MTAKAYFNENRGKVKALHCTKQHGNKCHVYKQWKHYHKARARKLQSYVKNKHVSVYEDIQRVVTVSGKNIQINGTVRANYPKCLRKVKSNIKGYPFTCKICLKQKSFLLDKLKKRLTTKHEEGKRFGLAGIKYEYLQPDEIVDGLKKDVYQKKIAARTNLNFKSSIKDIEQNIWISSINEDERSLVTNVMQLIENGIATNDKVHFTILGNLVKKLHSKKMFHYSDLIVKVGKLLRNKLGRTSYALASVSKFINVYCLF